MYRKQQLQETLAVEKAYRHDTLHIVDYNLKNEIEHGLYVSALSVRVAEEMELPEEFLRNLKVAGFLHDIGKLRLMHMIADDARDPLVIEQMNYVRMHAKLSADILRAHGYSEDIARMVRAHHENVDGTGYPNGLAGKEIPLGARILRACDVFAALTTDRPYRSRFSMEMALELMVEEITHFDMQVFLALQKVAHEVGTSYFHTLDNAPFGTEEEAEELFIRMEETV